MQDDVFVCSVDNCVIESKCTATLTLNLGAIQVLRNADGGGCQLFWGKKRYEGVMFNVISVMKGWVGSKCQKKALRNT